MNKSVNPRQLSDLSILLLPNALCKTTFMAHCLRNINAPNADKVSEFWYLILLRKKREWVLTVGVFGVSTNQF